MKKIGRTLIALLLVFALLPCVGLSASAAPGVSVTVNGSKVQWTDAEPFIDENGRTMVPLRAVANALGLEVNWNDATRTASFTGNGKTISFPIGVSGASTSLGTWIEMDTAAVIVNDRTYAPVRYLAEFFGYTVDWDGGTRNVIVTDVWSDVETIHYEWDWMVWTWSWDLDIPVAAVNGYKSIQRDPYSGRTGYSSYVSEPTDDAYLSQLAQAFTDAAERNGWSEDTAVQLAVSFVQSLKYTPDDIGLGYDYPKYPLETLYDQGGDCEDTSILLVSLIKEMGYGCCLIMFDDHMGVGILGSDTMAGSYFPYNGKKYFYVETTDEGWDIGEMPPELIYKTATIWPF